MLRKTEHGGHLKIGGDKSENGRDGPKSDGGARAEQRKKRHNEQKREMTTMGERMKAMRRTDLLLQMPCILIRAEHASCFVPCCASPPNFLPLITVKAKQIKALRRMDYLLSL